MKKGKKSIPKKLDLKEEEILKSFENDEWEKVKNYEKEKTRAHTTAENTLRKGTYDLI